MLSLMLAFSFAQTAYAAENTMQVVFEDATGSADTLKGEAKVKISIKETGGSISAAQLRFNFSGSGEFKSVAYSDEINKLVKNSGGGQPFFVQPIDAKSANASKSFDIAFTGAAKYSLPVSASGTEIAVVTFSGEPDEEITLATGDLENSFCVIAPNITEPKNHVAAAETITVKFSNTTKTGVKLTASIDLAELKESGGFADDSEVSLKLANTENNQVRSFRLSEADKKDAASYKFEIDKLAAGTYNISLAADGFVSKALENVNLNADKEINITSDNFYAGDVNADGRLTLLDYNRFISMYDAKAAVYDGIDYNRDGSLTQYDLLAFIASAGSHMENGAAGGIPAALGVTSSVSEVKPGDTFTITLTLDGGDKNVNSYYIKASYPKDIATLSSAECAESNAENKAVNTAEDGKLILLNSISDAAKKEIYKLTFKAEKSGSFALSFDNAEGALFYDVGGEAEDNLLNITVSAATVTVKDSDDNPGGGGGGGFSGSGGGSSGGSSGGSAAPSASAHKAYVSGYSNKTIKPDNNITRAEAAAFISRISTGFNSEANYDVSKFADVDGGAWFAKNVGYAAENGIVSGYEDGTFKPENTITREEFAVMLCRFMKYDTGANETFSDVPAEHWAASYLAAMKAKGIIGGYEDGSFGMGRKITRAEAIVMINRALGRVPSEEKIKAYISSNGYPATDIQEHWAAAQIIEAAAAHDVNILH